MLVRHKIALSDIKVAIGCQNGAKIHVLSSNAIDFLFPLAPIHILFDLQRSFTTQIQALSMLYMLVRVREMKRDGYTTVCSHL